MGYNLNGIDDTPGYRYKCDTAYVVHSASI